MVFVVVVVVVTFLSFKILLLLLCSVACVYCLFFISRSLMSGCIIRPTLTPCDRWDVKIQELTRWLFKDDDNHVWDGKDTFPSGLAKTILQGTVKGGRSVS